MTSIRPTFRPDRSERHYVRMGRAATVVGTLLSVGTSYIATRFANMGDYLVLVFSLFIFPMSAAFLLGMFWKRATSDGAFYGMIMASFRPSRTTASITPPF